MRQHVPGNAYVSVESVHQDVVQSLSLRNARRRRPVTLSERCMTRQQRTSIRATKESVEQKRTGRQAYVCTSGKVEQILLEVGLVRLPIQDHRCVMVGALSTHGAHELSV
jgi:hypothetical protein